MLTDKTLDDLLHQLRLIEEHREKNCEIKIRKYYKELMKDLNNFLGNEYAELAQDDKLTFEILHSKGKYARFIEEVEQRTNYFTGQAAKTIKDTVQTTYKKAFDGMVKAVEQSQSHYDLKLNLKGIKATTSDVIKNAVKNTFLEDALEKNHKTVIYDIKQQIGVGLSHGDRMSTMAKRINEQLDKDYKKATQIVRTECHRVREAGYQDSSEHINNMLKDSDCDYVMVKVWKTKKDERVRPQQRRKSKKGWKTTFSNSGANHMVMDGVTVLVDESFELPSGAKAMAPGQSGVANEDINCRCGVSRDFMTKAEYAKISGKKADNTPTENIKKIENSAIFKRAETETSKALKKLNVEYVEVSKHTHPLTEKEIIKTLGGGDRTTGSCASVGLAYAGQKQGWNVLDFRGGKSMEFFSNKMTKVKMFKELGVNSIVENSAKTNYTNGKNILNKLEKGKEYYLSVGRHAAIVKKNENDVLQYLELQSLTNNGWHDFTFKSNDTLKYRFGCSKSSRYIETAYATDISQLTGDDFRTILGYINTAIDKQKKGVGGSAK